jgi:hypothetical protein
MNLTMFKHLEVCNHHKTSYYHPFLLAMLHNMCTLMNFYAFCLGQLVPRSTYYFSFFFIKESAKSHLTKWKPLCVNSMFTNGAMA